MLDDGQGCDVVVRSQLVHQAPGGVGVEEVQVGELLASVLGDVVPPRVLSMNAVAGAVLVRVLAIAQDGGALQGQVDAGGR